jgi:hypothetical protein
MAIRSCLVGVLALAVGYWFPVRRWFSRWGTTADELARAMPGDGLIANPTHTATQAVTVDARAGEIWPWPLSLDHQRTRLVTRGIERVPNTALAWLFMRMMEPASFIMTRRMLLGVKQRAEAIHASTT